MRFLQERGLSWGGLYRLVLANLRESGFSSTFRKAVAHLGQSGASFSLDRYARWYRRYGLEQAASPASLFAASKVVIVGALDIPQCKKYRVLQKVEYLTSKGIDVSYSEYRDIDRAFSMMQLATVMILYRVPDGETAQVLLAEADRLGLEVFYDIDDPIFDQDCYSLNRNLDTLARSEKAALLRQVPQYASIMSRVGQLIVSTEGMKRLAEESLEPRSVVVWPNLLDGASLSVFDNLAELQERSDDAVVLGYFSGSRAHDSDFETIVPVLIDLLARYDNLRLRIGGHVDLPSEFAPYASRIDVSRFLSYSAYLDVLRRVDINLVPLVPDGFNDCKSAIRYLEASLCGIPTVATAIGQFTELVTEGENGFLCRGEDQWLAAVGALVDSREKRERMGASARNHVMQTQRLTDTDRPELLQAVGLGECA